MDSLKVFHVTGLLPPYYSGAGMNDMLLAKSLRNSSLDILLITKKNKINERSKQIIDGCNVRKLGLNRSRLGDLIWLIQFIILIYNNKPNLIRFRGYSFLYSVSINIIKLFFKNIKIVCQPACYGVDNPNIIKTNRLGNYQLSNILKSDAIFAMNEKIELEFIKEGFLKKKIIAIRNPVNTNNIINSSTKSNKSSNSKQYIFCTIGAIDKRKKQLDITKAFCKSQNSTNSKLLHIGPKESDLNLLDSKKTINSSKNQITKLTDYINQECKSNVKITGYVENVYEYLNDSDVLIHASDHEGEANAVNEALASGLLVIVPDTLVYSRQVPDGVGIKIDMTIEKLTQIISKYIELPEKYSSIRKQGKEYIKRTRNIKIISKEYKEIIEKVCKQ
ncbi:MAG: glycosyltransferase [Candidatus Thiodiazotropha sp. DIVDIV]